MAAGLGFKTFNTGDVLSAADTNGYLMQGVLVFADAAARNAAITSPQEGQFAYLKDTNVTTYYTGSAWANLDTTGMVNPMTTTGDTIYSSSGSTPARLGIGSTGNVLTVSGGVPVWAAPAGGGSLTLLSTTTISGTSTTVSSISQSYKHLYIMIYGVLQPSASPYRWETNISGSVYTRNMLFATNSIGQYALAAAVGSAGDGYNDGAQNPKTTGGNNLLTITIENYANTNIRKLFYSHFGYEGTSADGRYVDINGVIASNTAISSFIFSNMASGSMTGGTIEIYGVN
jgi:hypothetical protein